MLPKIIKTHGWVILAVIMFVAVMGMVAIIKYQHGLYNGFDLAIFTNVLANAVAGNGMYSTLNGHHYFADHFSPILYAVVPWFRAWPQTLGLAWLQIVVMAATAWPVYLLTRQQLGMRWAQGAVWFWLFNPLVINATLYEFHTLSFALVALLWAVVMWQNKRLWPFILWCLVALWAREDIALIVGAFSLIGFAERRTWAWRLWPAVLGVAWLVLAKVVMSAAGGSSYLFTIYYEWLWQAPQLIAPHLLSGRTVAFVVALLFPFAFLPLVGARRWWWLMLGPLAQMLLSRTANVSMIVGLHYSLLFLPGLVLLAIDGCARVLQRPWPSVFASLPRRQFVVLALTFLAIFNFIFLSALPGVVVAVKTPVPFTPSAAIQSVVASATVLPQVANRPEVYVMDYFFSGQQQFNSGFYVVPTGTPLVLALADLVAWQITKPQEYMAGTNRLRQHIAAGALQPGGVTGGAVLWSGSAPESFYAASPMTGDDLVSVTGPFGFIGITTSTPNEIYVQWRMLDFAWTEPVVWKVVSQDGSVIYLPVLADLLTVSSGWQVAIRLPRDPAWRTMQLVKAQGVRGLDARMQIITLDISEQAVSEVYIIDASQHP